MHDSAAQTPPLNPRALHLWCASVISRQDEPADLIAHLSDAERARAGQYLREGDRRRFIVSRALLRILLGSYTGIEPAALPLTTLGNGKPILGAAMTAEPLHFSLSHSGEKVVLAFTRLMPLGVDIEKIRSLDDYESLARRWFSPEEAAWLAALPESGRLRAFFECWTRKESFLKVTGVGLSGSLSSFSVAVGESESPRIIQIEGDETEAAAWTLITDSPWPDYALSICLRCRPDEILILDRDTGEQKRIGSR